MTISYKRLGVPYTVAQSAVAVPLTGNTNETTLATITISAGAVGPNGRVTIISEWFATNNANTKTIRVRLGGAAGTAFLSYTGITSVGSARLMNIIRNVNSESSQTAMGTAFITFQTSASTTPVTSSVDTSAETTIVITGQLATGTDALTLAAYSAEIVYGA